MKPESLCCYGTFTKAIKVYNRVSVERAFLLLRTNTLVGEIKLEQTEALYLEHIQKKIEWKRVPQDCFVALLTGSGLTDGAAIHFCPTEMVEMGILVIRQPGSVDELTD